MKNHIIYIEKGSVAGRYCLLLRDDVEYTSGGGKDHGLACRLRVSPNAKDAIQWCAPSGTATIKFANASPLSGGLTTVYANVSYNGMYCSGPVVNGRPQPYAIDPGATDRYKYTVSLDSTTLSEDPQVIIDDQNLLEKVQASLALHSFAVAVISLLIITALTSWIVLKSRRVSAH